jgi:hypothetical protein
MSEQPDYSPDVLRRIWWFSRFGKKVRQTNVFQTNEGVSIETLILGQVLTLILSKTH